MGVENTYYWIHTFPNTHMYTHVYTVHMPGHTHISSKGVSVWTLNFNHDLTPTPQSKTLSSCSLAATSYSLTLYYSLCSLLCVVWVGCVGWSPPALKVCRGWYAPNITLLVISFVIYALSYVQLSSCVCLQRRVFWWPVWQRWPSHPLWLVRCSHWHVPLSWWCSSFCSGLSVSLLELVSHLPILGVLVLIGEVCGWWW